MKSINNKIAKKLLHDNPLYIADIGASGGIDDRWTKYEPYYKGILFEPDEKACELLKTSKPVNHIVINSALSEKMETLNIHCCKKQQVSSVYTPNFDILKRYRKPERFDIVKTISVSADTLDNQLEKENINDVDFIKVDVQGHELPILKGGKKALGNCLGLEIEVEFIPLYEKQPLFSDVDDFVRKSGFELFDLERTYFKRINARSEGFTTSRGQLAFGNALYFRSPEFIADRADFTQNKIIRAICIYLAYGYPELGNALFELAGKNGKLSGDIIEPVTSSLSMYKIPRRRSLGKIIAQKLFKNISRAYPSEAIKEDITGNYTL